MQDFLTIAEAGRAIAARSLSPLELTRHLLARIERLDPILHAFIRVTPERALDDARAAESRIVRDGPKGPLDGIPIAHKDIYDTAGIPTTAHSRLLEDNIPARDGTVVTKLAEAGTIMLGKLSTHEFAFGGPSFDLPWPPARNPWNPDHFTAGSSSGTGAGVAAGLFLGGTGSDTGGSIRGPAALCGIAGIKPTYGLCSRFGVIPLSQTLDHTGPMAWTAEDCAILLQAMAGHDPQDPGSADRPVPDFRAKLGAGVRGLRIGIPRHFHETDSPVSPAIRKGIEDAAEFFRREGAEVRDVTLAPLADYQAVNYLIMLAEAWAIHEPWLRREFNRYGELLRDRVAFGGMISAADYVQATRRRRELCVQVAEAMRDLDLLLTAASLTEAPRIEAVPKWANLAKPGYTSPFNVTGQPAISVCSGFGEGGLPIAIQLVGKPFQDATVLGAAHAYETAHPWRSRRPAMAQS